MTVRTQRRRSGSQPRSGVAHHARFAVPDLPGQRGILTRNQLYDVGWTKAAVAHRLQRDWRLLFPGVVVPHNGPVDHEQRLIGGQLWAGPTAVLTGVHALAGLGVKKLPTTAPVFLVPATCRSRSTAGARTVRTTRPAVVAHRSGVVRFASTERALADAARYGQIGPEQAEALTIAVLQRGLTVPVRVERELWASRTNRLEPIRRGLREFTDGAWSLPEATLGRLVETSEVLPPMLRNRSIRNAAREWLGRPDGYFPDAGLAVQVHSREYHSGRDEEGRDRWADTVEKDSGLVSGGVIVLGVTPQTLARRPTAFLRRLETAYLAHRGRPLPELHVEDA